MSNKDDLKKSLIKNSFWSFTSLIISRLGAILFTVILARLLTPEHFGLYSIVFSTAMIFHTFADLGINQALLRYLSYAISNEKKKVYSYYRYLLRIKFLLSLGSALLLLALAYPLSKYIFTNNAIFLPIIVSAVYIFILAFENFYTQLFYVAEKIEYLSIKEAINQSLRIIVTLPVLYLVASSYKLVGVFSASVLVSLIVLCFIVFYGKKLVPEIRGKSIVAIDKSKVRGFVGSLTIISISSIFFMYADSIVLGIFLQPEYVGYYKVASSLIFGLINIAAFPTIILLPILTKLNPRNKALVFNNVFRYIAMFSFPAMLMAIVLGKYILRLFFGYTYLQSYLPFVFLSFLIFPVVSINLFSSLFSAKGKPQILARLILFTCVLNIILNILFVKLLLIASPLWAATGAAIATLLSWSFYLFSMVHLAKKEFNLKIPIKNIIMPIIASLIMALAIYFVLPLIKDMTLFSGLAIALFGVAVYLFIMILIGGIAKRDFNTLKILLKK